MHVLMAALIVTGSVEVETQHLDVRIDPAKHSVDVRSRLTPTEPGPLRFRLTERAAIGRVVIDGQERRWQRTPDEPEMVDVMVPEGAGEVAILYRAHFEEDVAEGERPGQIHNFSVDAHAGADGIFLSPDAAWHPQPVDAAGRPQLHRIDVAVAPMDGWVLVASGDPIEEGPLDDPRWQWSTPRPVKGVAIAGNRHALWGVTHETAAGAVEIVMQAPAGSDRRAAMFLEAARGYLDLYTPLLGAYPYRRFTIVENFFSSGFAYPGFTVLGPQVVAMAPRSLGPGYLDHELLHNWWGNGVYVDPDDGNWCEALTTFCTNYGRRLLEEGEPAARAYRRGILMKLSTDPTSFDDGALGVFGSADPSGGGPSRFVGYDKGAFVFIMLDAVLRAAVGDDPDPMWSSLRRLAEQRLGRRAGWSELQVAFEATDPTRPAGWLDGFFKIWVRDHTVPYTVDPAAASPEEIAAGFRRTFDAAGGPEVVIDRADDGAWIEIDPAFTLYRVLPPDQIVPTVSGTFGLGGVAVVTEEDRAEVTAFRETVEEAEDAENVLVIGAAAAGRHADLLARGEDPIVLDTGSFTVGGKTYAGAGQAVLHTMQHPERPGRFVTVFHGNGDAGYERLRVIRFYSRDTTIVWEDGQVIERRIFEPDRRIPVR